MKQNKFQAEEKGLSDPAIMMMVFSGNFTDIWDFFCAIKQTKNKNKSDDDCKSCDKQKFRGFMIYEIFIHNSSAIACFEHSDVEQ